jgi:predicted phage-related endonuclease
MTLNAAQIARRVGKLTASRVACLMTGDAEKIHRLWLEMIGEELPEDLSHIWAVRLGAVTEELQLDWYEERQHQEITRRGEVCAHPDIEWVAATLDGWITELACPIECKHVGGREPLEVVIDRYQPQMQWQMFVTNAQQCALTIIVGANPPIVEFIERADDYIDEMVKRGDQFMQCVASRTPPVDLPAVPSPVDAKAVYDMSGSNEWCSYAVEWLDTRTDAKRNEDSSKLLKSLVPPDAKKAHGAGVSITRNRAGSLSLREERT